MIQEHQSLDLARRMWTAAADGDATALRGVFAEDIVWRSAGDNAVSGEYRGIDSVLDLLARVGELVDDLSSTLNSVFYNDDGAVLLYHVAARRGAIQIDMDVFLMLLVRDGLINVVQTVPFDQRAQDRFWS